MKDNINDEELTIENLCSSKYDGTEKAKFVMQERISNGSKILLKRNITYELTSDKFFYISKYIRMCLIVSNSYYFGEQRQIHDHSLAFQHLIKNYDQLKSEYYAFLDRISLHNIKVARISELVTYETDSSDERYLKHRKYENKFDDKNNRNNIHSSKSDYNHLSIIESNNYNDKKDDLKRRNNNHNNHNNNEEHNNAFNTNNTNQNKRKVKNTNIIKDSSNLRNKPSKSKSRSRSRSISNNRSPSVYQSSYNEERTNKYHETKEPRDSVDEFSEIFKEANEKYHKNLFLYECNIGANCLTRKSASVAPARRLIIVPTFPNTASRISSVN